MWEYPAAEGTFDGTRMEEDLQDCRDVELGGRAGLLTASLLGLSIVFEAGSPALLLWDSAASVVSEWVFT